MAKDILVGTDFDLLIKGGDFVVGDSNTQHQQALLLSEKGEFKQFPTTGVGLKRFINDDQDGDDLQAEIQSELEADGATIDELKVKALDDITINAHYGQEGNG